MKKRNAKKIFTAIILAATLVMQALPVGLATGAEAEFSSVIMNIGADETMRNVTWYSNCKQEGEIRYAKASEMIANAFPESYETFPAIVTDTTKTGYYSYKATMPGLEENTEYVYCLAVGDSVSETYSFKVNVFDDEYSFVLTSDAQVSTYGGPSWSDTLQKIKANFPDASFIVSAGDQLETPTSEENYDNFIVDETAETAIAITLGTSHDNAQPYKEHYNLPNLSSNYGVSEITSNYYYKYNSTLFMHINIESTDVESHAEFVERTIKNNPDCIWQIVVIHYSLYSGANYDKETTFRNTLSPKFSELGVDAVFSGHHHFYARSELMSGAFVVSEDVIKDNTVTDPEGVLYIDAGPASDAPGFTDGSGIGSDYTLKQDFEARKKAVVFNMTESSMTMNAYYMDGDEPEVFDTFTVYHSTEKVRLNGDTDMLEVSDGGERVALVDAYAYKSAIVKAVNGYWAVSEDGGAEYTSLGIETADTTTVLALNEQTGYWELSEDGGESYKALPININKYTVTYVTDAEQKEEINLSNYPKHNVSAEELPDDVSLILPQGSIEDGVLHEWEWRYYNAAGEEVTEFSAGEDYMAYLVRSDLSVSSTLYIAGETNAAEGIYTWSDAWNIIKKFPGTEFTLALTEDITLSSSDAANLALAVCVTVDLAGYTLEATAVSNLIVLDQGTSTSNIKISTSQSGGELAAQSVFFLSSGAGTTLNLTVGGEGSEAVSVKGKYLANADNNFKTRAILNLSINEGTYELASGILRVDNYRPEEARRNTYNINAENADMSFAASPVYFRGSGYSANSDSIFKAQDTSFKYLGAKENAPFFSGADWYGSADFENCSFSGITFDLSYLESVASVAFGAGCSFEDYGDTFNSEKTAFASEKAAVKDGLVLEVDGNKVIVSDPNAPIAPEADSVVLDIANEADENAGVITWGEAWTLVNTNTDLKYHIRLTEDITLESADAVSLPAAVSVNTILDLAGYTLDSTAPARMITFANSSTKLNSSVRIISSSSGGVLNSNAVFYLTPGTGDTFNLTFGGTGSRTLSVKGTYLADSTNNFKNGSNLYLNINEGTYELSSALFDVDNYRDTSTKNNYYISINDANIITNSSTVVFKDTGYCASSASAFMASDSSFTAASASPFFAKDQWLGTAEFDNCSFNAVNFNASYVQSTAGISFEEGCIFKNFDSTFNSAKNAFSSDKLSIAEDLKLSYSSDGTVTVKSANMVTVNISVIGGDNVSINGSDKGATTVEDVNMGSVLEMVSGGAGEFLYWVDSESNTILSYDESYTFTAGTDRSIAAIYADDTAVFVAFTSMANKLLASGTAESITVPENPYVYGYKFDGWYKGGVKTSLAAGGAVTALENSEFKAGFIKDSTAYTVTVNGEEGIYKYNEKVSAEAEAEKDGKAFSYWMRDGIIVSYDASYSFYVSGNTALEAVYGEEAVKGIILVMAQPVLVDTNKIAFFAERDIAEGYEIIETGILMGCESGLTVQNALYKATAKSTENKGQYTVRKKEVASGDVYYGTAYAICRNESGEVVTLYSNEVSYTVE